MKMNTRLLSLLALAGFLVVGTGCTDELVGGTEASLTSADALMAHSLNVEAPRSAAAAGERTRLLARLAATDADPLASGKTKFESRPDRTRFSTEVEDVSADGAGEVVVSRDGVEILRAGLDIAGGFGDLNMDSRRGDDVPDMMEGDLVELFGADGALLMSGTLAARGGGGTGGGGDDNGDDG